VSGASSIIAAPGGFDGVRAGAVVYWSLRGSLDVSALTQVWEDAELPPEILLHPPSPDAALSRAVRTLASPRTLVRPLEGRKGYALVHERAKGDDLEHVVGLSVRLDAVGRLQFLCHKHGNWLSLGRDTFGDTAALKQAQAVQAAYDQALGEAAPEDVGGWLVRIALKYLDGVGLRDAGGFYYIPPAHVASWESVKRAVRAVSSHKLQQIDAMRSEDVVDAVLDAVDEEAQVFVEKTFSELADEMGVRALRTRVKRAEQVEAKVRRYEGLLGMRLEKLRERVGECQAAVAAAILRAEAETEAA